MACELQTTITAACSSGIGKVSSEITLLQLIAQLTCEASQGSGGGAVWGAITGTLSDQTDLQTELNAKLNLSGGTMTGLLTIAQATANTNALAVTGYSLTGANAQSLLSLAGTWNTSGTPTAIDLNITDTASNASSLLMDLRVGGVSRFTLTKVGVLTLGSGAGSGTLNINGTGTSIGANVVAGGNVISLSDSGGVFIGNSSDVAIRRDASDVLAQLRTTNAQTFRWYRTFTDASNYERGALQTAAGQVILAAETAGTGTDNIDLVLTPAGTGNVTLPGGVLIKTLAALTDGAAAALGTLANAPAAGNPTKWIPINDNGTTRYIPAW